MHFQKPKIKKFIAFLVFLLLIWEVFIHCTYLFRDTYRAGRQNLVGFYSEKEDSLDVVLIGASSVYRYWDCMYAWKGYGIASYDYSVGSMSPAATIFAIKEIKKTQDPQLFVFDVRKILSRFPDTTGGVWGTLDAQDYSLNRLSAVAYYCKLNGIALKDAWAEIIDIMTYHSNHAALASKLSWQLWDNRADESLDTDGYYKGFSIDASHAFVTGPEEDIFTDQTKPLDGKTETVYLDILEYCQENDIPLLLVASPFVVTADDVMEFNRMEEIAQEYGFPFLNANQCYEEMGLDFSTDFYDEEHVNLFGSAKYTDFLARYIKDHYEISHRQDREADQLWESIYARYALEAEGAYAELHNTIEGKKATLEMEAVMRDTDDATDWLTMAYNDDITVFVLKHEGSGNAPSIESRAYLRKYGLFIEPDSDGRSYMGRVCQEVLYGSSIDVQHESTFFDEMNYVLSVWDTPQITIGGINYYQDIPEGIHMLAYDNHTQEAFDYVVLQVEEDGSLTMQHCDMK